MVGNEGEDSVVLYLRMEEREDAVAGVVYDSSNQANNMTVNGAAFVEPTDAPVDKGDNDKVKTLRVGYFHPDPQRRFFTVEMWVKRDPRNGYMVGE